MSDALAAIKKTMGKPTAKLTPLAQAELTKAVAAMPTNGERVKKLKHARDDEDEEEDKVAQATLEGETFDEIGSESAGDDEGDENAMDEVEEDVDPQAERPKPKPRQRRETNTPGRAQNVAALKNRRKSVDYGDDALKALIQSATTVVLRDYFKQTPSNAADAASLWGALVQLTASKTPLPDGQLPPPHTSASCAADIVKLGVRLVALLEGAIAADDAIRVFRDTFLREVAEVAVLERDEAIPAEAPVKCEMICASVPAGTTIRIKIKYAEGVAPEQTLVVAKQFGPLVQALRFVKCTPAAILDVCLPRIHQKLKTKEFAAPITVKAAVGLLVGEQSATTVVTLAFGALKKTVTALVGAPTAFDGARKTVVTGAAVEESDRIKFSE